MLTARLVSATAFVLGLLALASCQKIVDRSGLQCTTTDDCRSRGVDFAGTRCSSEGICEVIKLPEGGLSLGSGCTTSLECKDRLNEAARCIDGACAALLPSGVPCSIIGPVENDDAVLLGALIPRAGFAGAEYSRAIDVIRYVTSEWNVRATGTRTKQVALVECDESELATTLPHLLGLHPRLIIGPFTNGKDRDFLKAAGDVTNFAPTVDDVALTDLPDARRRQFACTPDASLAVKPFQTAIAAIADRIAQARGIPNKARVSLVSTTDAADAAFAAKVEQGLVINGALASAQPDLYHSTSVSFDPHVKSPVVGQAQTVALDTPDVVVLTTPALADDFIAALDLRWAALHGATAPKPAFLLLHTSSVLEESFKNSQKVTKDRFFAVDWTRAPENTGAFNVLAGELLFREVVPSFATGFANDCTFAALYSMLAGAAGGNTTMQTVSAQQIVDGVPVVTQGSEAVTLVVDQIPKGVGLLGASPIVKTRLVGAQGALQFQPSGTAVGTAGLFCVTSETAPAPRAWAATGVTYDTSTGVANGTIVCP